MNGRAQGEAASAESLSHVVTFCSATFYGLYTCGWHRLGVDINEIVCYAKQVAFAVAVALEILFHGKLGVMRVVTSQLGFTRPFSIGWFVYKVCCSNCHIHARKTEKQKTKNDRQERLLF